MTRLPTPDSSSRDMVRAMDLELYFDYLGVRLDGAKAGDRRITIGCVFPDIDERWTLMVRHGTLSHRPGIADDADATLTIARDDLDGVVLGQTTLADLLQAGSASLEGDAAAVRDLVALLDDFDFWFDIVTP